MLFEIPCDHPSKPGIPGPQGASHEQSTFLPHTEFLDVCKVSPILKKR